MILKLNQLLKSDNEHYRQIAQIIYDNKNEPINNDQLEYIIDLLLKSENENPYEQLENKAYDAGYKEGFNDGYYEGKNCDCDCCN